jgi:hypothetical protein
MSGSPGAAAVILEEVDDGGEAMATAAVEVEGAAAAAAVADVAECGLFRCTTTSKTDSRPCDRAGKAVSVIL